MILGISGTRTPSISYNEFKLKLLCIQNVTEIVSGGARGIDSYAENYAEEFNIPIKVFKPEYPKYGRSAPLVRNKQIVDYSDKVLCFPSESSIGTIHTINYAKSKNKLYNIIEI